MRIRAGCDTIVVTMIIEPVRTVKARLSEYLDRVEKEHDRVLITRNGRASAVLISYEELESIEETLAILSEPGALEELQQAQRDFDAGISYTLEEARVAVEARLRKQAG